MVVVLGSIFAGCATPTESAGVGVLGSILIAWMNGRFSLQMMKEAIRDSCRANGLVFMILLGATGFSLRLPRAGRRRADAERRCCTLGIDTPWEMLIFVMVLIFLLGFPFEWIEICLIVLPIFAPILAKMRFLRATSATTPGSCRGSPRWWRSTCRPSFMSPPFGATLFYMKGTVPPGVSMTDVYRGMYPFVILQVIGLFLCIYFPEPVAVAAGSHRHARLTR